MITREWLIEHHACKDRRDEFLAAHPGGAHFTRALLDDPTVRPHYRWLTRALPLGAEPSRVYDAARAEALRVYGAAMAEALRVYDAAMAEPLRVYDAARAEPSRVYGAARPEPGHVYDAAMAEALWTAIVASGLAG